MGQRDANLVDRLPADIRGGELERVVILLPDGLQHPDGFRDDFPPHTIACQHCDLCLHVTLLLRYKNRLLKDLLALDLPGRIDQTKELNRARSGVFQ